MSRRKVLTLILVPAGVVLGLGLALFLLRMREPVYEGKSLSAWLSVYRSELRVDGEAASPRALEASDAVRQIGTNAVPFLVEWISFEQPGFQRRMLYILRTITRPLGGHFGTRGRLTRGAELRQAAVSGFKILGPEAAGAVPKLTRLIQAPKSRATWLLAMDALTHLGPHALPPLLNVLTNPASTDQLMALESLGEMTYLGTNARPAIVVMIECLKHKDSRIAEAACEALGRLALEPDLVVPVLVENLQNDSRESMRSSAADALAGFGERARVAIPALEKALKDPSEEVRTQAEEALEEIAPELKSR